MGCSGLYSRLVLKFQVNQITTNIPKVTSVDSRKITMSLTGLSGRTVVIGWLSPWPARVGEAVTEVETTNRGISTRPAPMVDVGSMVMMSFVRDRDCEIAMAVVEVMYSLQHPAYPK